MPQNRLHSANPLFHKLLQRIRVDDTFSQLSFMTFYATDERIVNLCLHQGKNYMLNNPCKRAVLTENRFIPITNLLRM